MVIAHHMLRILTLLLESFQADITTERRLSCMDTDMIFHISLFVEMLTTFQALKLMANFPSLFVFDWEGVVSARDAFWSSILSAMLVLYLFISFAVTLNRISSILINANKRVE